MGYNNRALLIGVSLPHIPLWEAENSLEELTRLADAALLITVEHVIQSRDRIDSAFFIGKGKVEEIKKQSKKLNADLLIFDNDLSPAQMRNLEDKTEMRILDRSALILDIFLDTNEQPWWNLHNNYCSQDLRMWTHLSRQAGGGAIEVGISGCQRAGETQLETDRRIIHRQINNLEKKLERINTDGYWQEKSTGNFSVACWVYKC